MLIPEPDAIRFHFDGTVIALSLQTKAYLQGSYITMAKRSTRAKHLCIRAVLLHRV
jgi:hypothetical protein